MIFGENSICLTARYIADKLTRKSGKGFYGRNLKKCDNFIVLIQFGTHYHRLIRVGDEEDTTIIYRS